MPHDTTAPEDTSEERASSDGLALVTGASGGLGDVIARHLAHLGHPLVLLYRRNRPESLLRDLGGAVRHSVAVDVADGAAVAEAVDTVVREVGDVHAAVHAAGPHIPMVHLSQVSPRQFAEQLDADVNGFFNVMHALLPSLRRTRGSMTAVTTAATTRYPTRDGLSSAPKAAVEALVRAFAAEEGRFGIRVNCVGPGMLTDGMAERLIASGDLDDRALAVARANIPLRTFGSATDIAEAVGFLASDRARFVSGQKLDVDGGYGV